MSSPLDPVPCEANGCNLALRPRPITPAGHAYDPAADRVVTDIPAGWAVGWVHSPDRVPPGGRLVVLCPRHSAGLPAPAQSSVWDVELEEHLRLAAAEEFELDLWMGFETYSKALIEIATGFWSWDFGDGNRGSACLHCGQEVHPGCESDCPGLRARVALGVA